MTQDEYNEFVKVRQWLEVLTGMCKDIQAKDHIIDARRRIDKLTRQYQKAHPVEPGRGQT